MKPKLMQLLACAILLGLTASDCHAIDFLHNLTVNVDNGQVEQGVLEDIWKSLQITFPQNQLSGGDRLILNVDFNNNGRISVTDELIGDDESIYFFIGGSGGTGGGAEQQLQYEWLFTDVSGDLKVNPITGTGTLFGISGNGIINNTNSHRNLNLTDSSFSFGDITLTVTVPNTIGSFWSPTFVRFEVDGDSIVVVPEPGTYVLGSISCFAVAAIGRLNKREKKRKQERRGG